MDDSRCSLTGEAVSTLKSGKAVGFDEIKPEMAKHSGVIGILWLLQII